MAFVKPLLLAGAALAGLSILGSSVAKQLDTHRVTVEMPGGGVETIEYTGKVAPKVRFEAVPVQAAFADPFAIAWPVGFGFPSFAALDRISAEMDRQMGAMMRQAEMLSRLPEDQALQHAVLQGLRPGTSFSMVSESFGIGACTRVTRITQSAQDAKPQVVSQTSGDCGAPAAASPAGPADLKQASFHTVPQRPARLGL